MNEKIKYSKKIQYNFSDKNKSVSLISIHEEDLINRKIVFHNDSSAF